MEEIDRAVRRFKIGCLLILTLSAAFCVGVTTGLITTRWYYFEFGHFRLKKSSTVLGLTYSSNITPTKMTPLAERIGRESQSFVLFYKHWGFIAPKVLCFQIVVLCDIVGDTVSADEREGNRWSNRALSQLCTGLESLLRRFLKDPLNMDLYKEGRELFLSVRKSAGIKGKPIAWWPEEE